GGRPVTVIGAGIAGLAAARALALRGARVQVLERASGLGEVGGGLQIAPNGVRVLDALGLGAGARAAAIAARAVELRDGFTGRRLTRLDLARHAAGRDYLLFHRADLVALLARGAEAAGAELRFNTAAAPEGEGLIIAADGFHSAARTLLNGAA